MKTKTKNERGYILWQGESWIDGSPVMAVATMKSANRKTGNMVQIWILRSDLDPVSAIKTGGDIGICGSCVHRGTDGFKGRSCYVDTAKAPLAVYRAARRGSYRTLQPSEVGEVFDNRKVRLGAYGDPAVLPEWLLKSITSKAWMHTGYTHQWHDSRAEHAKPFCMASCDKESEVLSAIADGWRVFFVGDIDQASNVTSMLSFTQAERDAMLFQTVETYADAQVKACPASIEEEERTGKDGSCDRCGLCCGSNRTNGRNAHGLPTVIFIKPHGAGAKHIATKVALTIGMT